MPNINLLPWRETLREQKTREFYVVLGGSGTICVLFLIVIHMILGGHIRAQKAINGQFRQEIALLDAKTREIEVIQQAKANLIARMEIIQQLQATRPMVVRLFDEIVRVLPNGVFVTNVRKEGLKVTLTGKAESNTRVSELMRNIEASAWVENPILTQIKNEGGDTGRVRDFELEMRQTMPKDETGSFIMDGQNGIGSQ